MTTSRRKFARANSGTSRSRHRVCPDSQVCPQCPDSDNCIYLKNQQKREIVVDLLEILERRVSLANTCLVNVRNLSRILGKKLNVGPKKLGKTIDEILSYIRAEKWGHACTEHRLEKWNVRPLSSKIYQIDQATLESLRWYIDQVVVGKSNQSAGGVRN